MNQRFLDVRVTAPREYASWEATCRELVGKQVARGRVEVYVGRNAPARGRTRVVLNVDAARDYAAAWRRLRRELGLNGDLDLGLLRGSEIFETVEMPRDLRAEFPVAEPRPRHGRSPTSTARAAVRGGICSTTCRPASPGSAPSSARSAATPRP